MKWGPSVSSYNGILEEKQNKTKKTLKSIKEGSTCSLCKVQMSLILHYKLCLNTLKPTYKLYLTSIV